MHYKNGKKAEIGDAIRFPVSIYRGNIHHKTFRTGVLVDVIPGIDTCNGTAAFVATQVNKHKDHTTVITLIQTNIVTLGECYKAEEPEEPADCPTTID